MGIQVDPLLAREVLDEAVTIAGSTRRLPAEWVRRTERLAGSPSKTYIAALGTALLARATEPRVDPRSIKERSGPRGYSVRSLGHGVLVPASVEYGFDLGATGREPLNNQPFFGNDRIEKTVVVRRSSQPYWNYLMECCNLVGRMSAPEAKVALASFIRQRLAAASAVQPLNLRARQFQVARLAQATARFITANTEGGKRGQACVAAAFDVAFTTVRMGRINDPSVRFPGDVQVLEGVRVVLPIEARQKVVAPGEVRQFAATASKAGVDRATVVALHPNQPPLVRRALLRHSERDHGVTMSIIESVEELLLFVTTVNASEPVDDLLARFRQRMLARLEEIEASQRARFDWVRLVG
jgi:hypothetical protein